MPIVVSSGLAEDSIADDALDAQQRLLDVYRRLLHRNAAYMQTLPKKIRQVEMRKTGRDLLEDYEIDANVYFVDYPDKEAMRNVCMALRHTVLLKESLKESDAEH